MDPFRADEEKESLCREFERRIAEADAYLQLMIKQVRSVEERAAVCEKPKEREALQQVASQCPTSH